ncbi:LrgB family protein [Methylophilus aquaticus]|uniref:LrgB family protein n=1 Tax=Methylophilus aquaticus TaxID=1971610 RepID=A0ABT9JTB7_9PROT|nr:LrgB family protein [Methylophilus aquaticus]MDP8567823.1 LrgB family protein [Methylophilus aquaticus]
MNKRLPISEVWVYLSGDPLFALIITLATYQFGYLLYVRAKRHPLVNPVAISVILTCVIIDLLEMPYEKYFEGAQFVHFLLGTATVALAIPIYNGFKRMQGKILHIWVALTAGSTVSIVSAVVIAKLMGAGDNIVGSMYAKSVTAPIAMGIAERLNVSPTLTVVFTVITGMLGAILAPYIMNALKIHQWWIRGTAIGVGAHGLGITRAFSVNEEAGIYASMAMGLNGVISAIGLPIVLTYLRPYLGF